MRIVNRGQPKYRERTVLANTVQSLYSAHPGLAPAARKEVARVAFGWAHALWNAVRTSQTQTGESLRLMAWAKAKKVEAAIRREQTHISLVNGFEVWIHPAVAPNSWTDNVETETQAFAVEAEPRVQEMYDIALSDQAVADKEAEE